MTLNALNGSKIEVACVRIKQFKIVKPIPFRVEPKKDSFFILTYSFFSITTLFKFANFTIAHVFDSTQYALIQNIDTYRQQPKLKKI
jgi:hypothetical protein